MTQKKRMLKKSDLYRLDPFTDHDGILRVGGRLRRAEMSNGEKHPVILPKNHHLSNSLCFTTMAKSITKEGR